MQAKLEHVETLYASLSTTATPNFHNKWDIKLGQLIWHSEKECTKFKSNAIEYSPMVGQWLKHCTVLKWLLRWHDGKVQDTRNMCRAARRANILDHSPLARWKFKTA